MSRNHTPITGSYHESVNATFKVKHLPRTMGVITFYNGKKRGKAVQLTIEDQYIHLNVEGCKQLIETLNKVMLCEATLD